MSLVIKIAGFKSEGEGLTLYKDALVNEGSLLLHDYSNRGSLRNGSIKHGSPFYDLASDVSKDKLGIDNFGTMDFPDYLDLELTDGGGIPFNKINEFSSSTDQKGVDMGDDLPQYLYDNNPNLLAIYWGRVVGENSAGALFLSTGDSNDRNLSLRISPTNYQGIIAGGSSGSNPVSDNIIQYGVRYTGAEYNSKFVNGVLSGSGTVPTTGFDENFSTLFLGSRVSYPSNVATGFILYRVLIYDLDKSELTAEQIVKKDWEYCNGIGEFAGLPTKRPFIDTV